MKIDEMIEVMKAYKEGKPIEFRGKGSPMTQKWASADEPIWDWDSLDYRVKPEPEYVPYDSVLEVNRDKWVKKKGIPRLIKINELDLDDIVCVRVGYEWVSLEDLFDEYTYDDGTPCGKLVQNEG